MNNKAVKLKLMCFIYVYLQGICEMIKYFDSWRRHVQKIVNYGCVAGGGHCL